MRTDDSRFRTGRERDRRVISTRCFGWFLRLGCLSVALWLGAFRGHAHSASTAWLALQVEGATVRGTWDIAVRDVDLALTLDADGDGRVTWGEVRQQSRAIERWAAAGLGLTADGASLPLQVRSLSISEVSGVDCLHLDCVASASSPIDSLEVTYGLLFDLDRMHRGLVRVVDANRPDGTSVVLGPDHRSLKVEPGSARSHRSSIGVFVIEGVHHIATGYDHLLFLLVLLLPTVVTRSPTGWIPVSELRPVLMRVLRTVTAFTIAHSITLALAALDWVRPPSRPIEMTIALSIVVTAIGNLGRRSARHHSRWRLGLEALEARPWILPFCFGLVHGFGFADGLRELGLTRLNLAAPLVGFNLGVEIGQLAAVVLVLPVLWKLGKTIAYRRWGLSGLSWAIAAIASVWVVDRAFGFQWLGG